MQESLIVPWKDIPSGLNYEVELFPRVAYKKGKNFFYLVKLVNCDTSMHLEIPTKSLLRNLKMIPRVDRVGNKLKILFHKNFGNTIKILDYEVIK